MTFFFAHIDGRPNLPKVHVKHTGMTFTNIASINDPVNRSANTWICTGTNKQRPLLYTTTWVLTSIFSWLVRFSSDRSFSTNMMLFKSGTDSLNSLSVVCTGTRLPCAKMIVRERILRCANFQARCSCRILVLSWTSFMYSCMLIHWSKCQAK